MNFLAEEVRSNVELPDYLQFHLRKLPSFSLNPCYAASMGWKRPLLLDDSRIT